MTNAQIMAGDHILPNILAFDKRWHKAFAYLATHIQIIRRTINIHIINTIHIAFYLEAAKPRLNAQLGEFLVIAQSSLTLLLRPEDDTVLKQRRYQHHTSTHLPEHH